MLCTHRAHLVLLGQSMQICKVYTQGTRRVKRTAHANMLCSHHRRRINTDEKAKMVAAVRKTEFMQFLAAPAILH